MRKYNVADEIKSPSALTQEQGDIIYGLISDAVDFMNEVVSDFEVQKLL